MTKLRTIMGQNSTTYYYRYNRIVQRYKRISKDSFDDILNGLENVTVTTFKNQTTYQCFNKELTQ